MMIQTVLGLTVVLGQPDLWHYNPLIMLVFLLPEILLLHKIPESVGFLQQTGQIEKARRASVTLYGKDLSEIDYDLDDNVSIRRKQSTGSALQNRPTQMSTRRNSDPSVTKNPEVDMSNQTSYSEIFKNHTLLKISIYIFIFNIFCCGIGGLQVERYATEIISSFNFSTLMSQIFTIILLIAKFLGALLASFLIKKIDRRHMMFLTVSGCLISTVVLLVIGLVLDSTTQELSNLKYAQLVGLLLLSLFWNAGMGTMSMTFAEYVPIVYKPTIVKINQLLYSIQVTAFVFVFPIITVKIGNYTYLIFIVLDILCLIWIKFRWIESRNQPSLEIFGKFNQRGWL